MMALIAIAVYDTVENGRSWMTKATLNSLLKTVDLSRHRIILSDNGSCDESLRFMQAFSAENEILLLTHGKNLGTARAINRAWEHRKSTEVAVKMDNDVTIAQAGWLDKIEDAFHRDPQLGIIGLKRKDLMERPDHPDIHYRSTLHMLPHRTCEEWLVVEKCQHIMGTCQAYSPTLLAAIGDLYQMQDGGNLYGFDDSLASFRAHLAGFDTAFLLGIDIEHIDPGNTSFTTWKTRMAGNWMRRYMEVMDEYRSGQRPVFWKEPT